MEGANLIINSTDTIGLLIVVLLVILSFFGTSPTLKKAIKTQLKINILDTITGRQKKLRTEIQKIIINNPKSLNFLKNRFESTGNINHQLLESLKEKVKNELEANIKLKNIRQADIDIYIEDELKKIIMADSSRPLFRRFKSEPMTVFTRYENLRTFIRRYPAVFFLVCAIIIIQLTTYYFGNGPTDLETARRFGAIQTTDTAPAEWFRLITSIFVQIGGTEHLLSNVASLIIFGPPLERIYGSAKFTFLFFATGITGGLFILIFSENVIAAGASSSIFGLIGLYLGLIIRKAQFIDKESKTVIWVAFVLDTIYTFVAPNISVEGHLGGLFGGLLLSLFVAPQPFHSLAEYRLRTSLTRVITVTLLCFSLLLLPRYVVSADILNKIMEKFEEVKLSQIISFNFDKVTSSLEKKTEQSNTREASLQINRNETVENDQAEELNEPSIRIIAVHSGVKEGWIDTTDSFFDEITLVTQVKNMSDETVDIYPEMFVLSDTGGYTPSLIQDQVHFKNIPLPPNQKVTVKLVYAVSLKQTTGQFLLSVSGWNSFDQFKIDY
ncbi:rhomboid family intramembrane serine protease [Geobacillus stearothermophilus]|uniref:rhomboid family intramembrane serine protease n=1 Tax=Geobacillus stearothermophilus TaxID=1422 RepID=UPI0007791156|nr:rhomboid family intramembrane serine protease [Geobacillus stearothermophilus]MED5042666.1 rhomboid family intramembrane serine protease [Geobacillus stearothermophilus]